MNADADSPADEEPLVDLVVEEPGWQRALPNLHTVATGAARLALEEAGLPAEGFSVTLLACDDARISVLNAEFRDRPGPTNVLSWPAFPLSPPRPGEPPPRPPAAVAGGARLSLGDLAIALETVVAEATSRDLPLKNHATHLILHGCLHLLGFAHGTPEDAALMEDLERRALARAGIPDPYQ